MRKARIFYTYIHWLPTGMPFYVGKGLFSRAHDLRDRSQRWKAYACSAAPEQVQVTLFEAASEKAAFDYEKELICFFRSIGIVLANRTDGGEGLSGWICSPDECARRSVEQKKRMQDPLYKVSIAEGIAKYWANPEKSNIQRAALRLRMYNRSEESVELAATKQKETKSDGGYKERIGSLIRAKLNEPENKIRHIEGIRRTWSNPTTLENAAKARELFQQDPAKVLSKSNKVKDSWTAERRKKASERMSTLSADHADILSHNLTARWADPTERNRLIQSQKAGRTPEVHARHSEACKNSWSKERREKQADRARQQHVEREQSPDYKQRFLESIRLRDANRRLKKNKHSN